MAGYVVTPPGIEDDPEFQRLDRECQLAARAVSDARQRVNEAQAERDKLIGRHRAALFALAEYARRFTEGKGTP